jgi:hypothetical protein
MKIEPVFTYLKIIIRTYTSGNLSEFMMAHQEELVFIIKKHTLLVGLVFIKETHNVAMIFSL